VGIESVSYRFAPSECEVADLAEWLRLRGATNGTREGTYVLSGQDYWVDLLVRADGPHVVTIRLRVAVTNPASVVLLLGELIDELRAQFGGQVTNASGRVLYDQDRLDLMVSEFNVGRERFTQKFGDLILPVSADQVFSQLREVSKKHG
jgi:hypothetical protein